MNTNATPKWRGHLSLAVLLLFISLGVAQILYLREELPARVASHFDGAGHPNGWMSRDGFVLFQCVLLLGLGALFGFGGGLLKVTPNGWINLPNKNYWLAPERRAESVAFLTEWLRWVGAGTLVFLMVVFQFTIQANLGKRRLDTQQILTVMGIFLAGLVMAVVWLYRRFRAPASKRI